ncbi:hypothetical protein FACS1894102_1750 [Spirochaetia bacterium]|nr:hypothetical protein FACS1894102_1750 [Spirochaetia bacterium]
MYTMIPLQYFFNYVSVKYDANGYAKFFRFYPEQLETYKAGNMFKTMSESAAGVVLSFITTGNSVEFKCKASGKLKTFLPVIKQISISNAIFALRNRPKENARHGKIFLDGVDFVVDGKLISTHRVSKGKMKFRFDNPLKLSHEVKIYFPVIFDLEIKDLKINGTVEVPKQKAMILCLGDSITQGFIAGSPSLNYVAQMSESLNVQAINQGVGGYIYDSKSLNGIEHFKDQFGLPKFITVAYGTNDWHYKTSYIELQKNISQYFKRLTQIFPASHIFVITPIWRGDFKTDTKGKIPFEQVSEIIKTETSAYKTITIIDGMKLIPHDFKYFSDVYLHPSAEGFTIMTNNICRLAKFPLCEEAEVPST